MSDKIHTADLFFSYNQFYIRDKVFGNDTGDWTTVHLNQGFVRLPHCLAIGTLRQFGEASLEVFSGVYEPLRNYSRVLEIPFHLKSGEVYFDDPDNAGNDEDSFALPPGHYCVVIAQEDLYPGVDETEVEDAIEVIDVFFELLDEPLSHSSILVRDAALNPPEVLMETGDVIKMYIE